MLFECNPPSKLAEAMARVSCRKDLPPSSPCSSPAWISVTVAPCAVSAVASKLKALPESTSAETAWSTYMSMVESRPHFSFTLRFHSRTLPSSAVDARIVPVTFQSTCHTSVCGNRATSLMSSRVSGADWEEEVEEVMDWEEDEEEVVIEEEEEESFEGKDADEVDEDVEVEGIRWFIEAGFAPEEKEAEVEEAEEEREEEEECADGSGRRISQILTEFFPPAAMRW